MTATTNFEKLIAIYISQIQELEQVFFQLINERTLAAAAGVQLAGIGSIVGEERNGRNDTVYRRAIEARILINLSNGTLEDVLAVVLRSLPSDIDLTVREDSFPNHFGIDVDDTVALVPASITTGAAETYTLSDGWTLTVEVDGGAPQVVTFNTGDFDDIAAATADKVAAVISGDVAGATAVRNSNRVTLRSDTVGDTSSIEVTGGTAVSALAFPTGLRTGPETNEAMMFRIARAMSSSRPNSVRGILLWNTHTQSFGFLGTPGALGFSQGAFANASDGL